MSSPLTAVVINWKLYCCVLIQNNIVVLLLSAIFVSTAHKIIYFLCSIKKRLYQVAINMIELPVFKERYFCCLFFTCFQPVSALVLWYVHLHNLSQIATFTSLIIGKISNAGNTTPIIRRQKCCLKQMWCSCITSTYILLCLFTIDFHFFLL